MSRVTNIAATATIADTIYPHGYVVGQTVIITVIGNDPAGTQTATVGIYNATITVINSPTQFTFTPGVPGTWSIVLTTANVFAQVQGSGPVQTLAQTTITNIFRLTQALPTIPSNQLLAMAGRFYRANLSSGPGGIQTYTTSQFTSVSRNGITATAHIYVAQGSLPFGVGALITVSGVADASFNGNFTVVEVDSIFVGPVFSNYQVFWNDVGAIAASTAGTITVTTTVPAFIELVLPSLADEPPVIQNGYSGRPLSLLSFRFTLDTASWAIIADQNKMAKFRESTGGAYLYFLLGNPIPPIPATASAGVAGNLDSTGGALYDWRYTYFDGYVSTEGNPSPIMPNNASSATKRPASFTNPDPGVPDTGPVTNPGNCIDGTDASITSLQSTVTNSPGVDPLITQESCLYFNLTNPAFTPSALTLSIDFSCVRTIDGGAGGFVKFTAYYSLDNGVTWTILVAASGTTSRNTVTTTIPFSTNLTGIRFRLVASGFSNDRHHESSKTMDVSVYDLRANASLSGGAPGISLTNQIGVVCVTPPGDLNDGRVTAIRLYRRGGSLPDAWRLVGTYPLNTLVQGTCGVGTLEIDDNVSDTQLSTQPFLELDNDAPVTSVQTLNQPLDFIWGPVGLDARVLGCGDPNRPECVYFSKPGNPDAWPPQNFIEVSEPGTPIIAGCVFNTQNFAFSRERIYQLVEGYIPGSTFTPFVTPSAHGLYSPWGLAIGPSIYFIAKDGIYETTGGQERSIVENDIKPLFPTYDTPGESVEGYEAVDMAQSDAMRLRYHNDELYFGYVGKTTGTRQLLVYDILKRRWRAAHYTTGISEVYSEPATISSLLLGTDAGAYYSAGGSFDPFELDVIENGQISSVVAGGVTLGAGSYYARMSRFTAAGEVALSNETAGLTVNGTHGIQAIFPLAPTGTTKWRVYYGTTVGQENQYQEYTEGALMPASRTVVIITAGTAGSVPTTNADHNIAVVLRTGANDQGAPLNQKQYGNVIFDLDPGGADVTHPVTITPYINGEVTSNATITVTGTGRQQVPLNLSDYFAFNTEYEVSWERADVGGGIISDPVLFQYDTLHFIEPVSVKHWQAQPTSFAFPGFIHCRDAYIAIRSTSVVTLTMTIDGTVVQTYTVPSTAGQRLKQYIQFDSNKGLVYQFALNADVAFRVYEEDLEIRCKPWLGVLGYSVQRVLGGEANA